MLQDFGPAMCVGIVQGLGFQRGGTVPLCCGNGWDGVGVGVITVRAWLRCTHGSSGRKHRRSLSMLAKHRKPQG